MNNIDLDRNAVFHEIEFKRIYLHEKLQMLIVAIRIFFALLCLQIPDDSNNITKVIVISLFFDVTTII